MIAKLTSPVFVSWYLFAVFLLGLLAGSAIDVAPGHSGFKTPLMAVCSVAALLFAVLAITLQQRGRRGLGLGIFRFEPFRLGYAVFAIIATLCLLSTVVG